MLILGQFNRQADGGRVRSNPPCPGTSVEGTAVDGARIIDLTTDLGALGLDDPTRFLARARAHGLTGTDDEPWSGGGLFSSRPTCSPGGRIIQVPPAASLTAVTWAVRKGRAFCW